MMIREDFSFTGDETAAKKVGADLRGAAFRGVDGIAIAVF